jgi:hypothetical protein
LILLTLHLLIGCQAGLSESIATPQPAPVTTPQAEPASIVPATTIVAGTTQPAATDPEEIAEMPRAKAAFDIIAREMALQGVYRSALVYSLTVPRDDLNLIVEGMFIPPAAGFESQLHFHWCPCGKLIVTGRFCLLDYEINDVIDALRVAKIEVVSVAPMLLHARQKPQALHFYGEGKPEQIANALREALRWTGKDRMAPQR